MRKASVSSERLNQMNWQCKKSQNGEGFQNGPSTNPQASPSPLPMEKSSALPSVFPIITPLLIYSSFRGSARSSSMASTSRKFWNLGIYSVIPERLRTIQPNHTVTDRRKSTYSSSWNRAINSLTIRRTCSVSCARSSFRNCAVNPLLYPTLLPALGFRPTKNVDVGDDNTWKSPAWERKKPPLPEAFPCLVPYIIMGNTDGNPLFSRTFPVLKRSSRSKIIYIRGTPYTSNQYIQCR